MLPHTSIYTLYVSPARFLSLLLFLAGLRALSSSACARVSISPSSLSLSPRESLPMPAAAAAAAAATLGSAAAVGTTTTCVCVCVVELDARVDEKNFLRAFHVGYMRGRWKRSIIFMRSLYYLHTKSTCKQKINFRNFFDEL